MAQKKMGRPPKGDKPMKDRIFVLVSDDTKEKLEQCKKALDTTTSDVVRRGIDKVYDELEKQGRWRTHVKNCATSHCAYP